MSDPIALEMLEVPVDGHRALQRRPVRPIGCWCISILGVHVVALAAFTVYIAFMISIFARPSRLKELTVLSWNILAREHTWHIDAFHNNTHPEDRVKGGFLESTAMTSARYSLVVAEILLQKPAVALLQEAEASFMNTSLNVQLPQLLAAYGVFPRRNDTLWSGGWNDTLDDGSDAITWGPGVVALVRLDIEASLVEIPGNASTGGRGKAAVMAAVWRQQGIVRSVKDLFMGIHLPWVGDRFTAANASGIEERSEKRQFLLSLAMEKLSAHEPACILGDFNVEAGDAHGRWPEVQSALHGFERVPMAGPTGLHTDLQTKVTIDHIFCRGIRVKSLELGPVASPYKQTPSGVQINAASDHAWITAHITRNSQDE